MYKYINLDTTGVTLLRDDNEKYRSYLDNSDAGRDALAQLLGADSSAYKQIIAEWGNTLAIKGPPPPSLDEQHTTKWAEVSMQIQQAIYTGIDYPTKEYGMKHFSFTRDDQADFADYALQIGGGLQVVL